MGCGNSSLRRAIPQQWGEPDEGYAFRGQVGREALIEKCNTLLSNNGEVYLGCSKFQLWYLITPDRKGVVISLVMLQGGKAVAKIQSTKASANYKDARTEFSRYVDTQINELLGTISTAPAKRDESSLRGPNINAPPSYKEDGQTESSSLGQNYRLTAWAP